MDHPTQSFLNDPNMPEEEKKVLVDANTRKEWESTGQWMKRKEFLLKMLSYHKQNNLKIDVDKFVKMGHMYYNMKYLSCTYSTQVVEEMRMYEQG
ncbi:hypothetical protein PCYB_093200 [Plasmodium cynomolgi strain B]|uniref:XRN2-binding (XTBD) domain-containing protein n=1 Tax=Plasmodium cynomolgi (strain B) TaxID=1120755 RepID=K6UW41_PLACD|nr:hypothetical protein PCYB_093200 [Plasmodium cynomolgi strain B]GAB66535.1 hypothetical protein PCYB_093200 [Plasmodium cynomolgi strain B]